MEIKQQLVISLQEIVKDLIGEELIVQVEIPNDLTKGDFTTNIAMLAFAKAKNQESKIKNYGSPLNLANEIIQKLNSEFRIHDSFRLIEAKQPGFINFYLSNEMLFEALQEAVKGFENKKESGSLIFEFGDLNPFKEPHIGHVRNLVLGESLARLFEFSGIKVVRANYEGDVGMHVAKCLYGFKSLDLKLEDLESQSLEEKVKALAKSYSIGAKAFEENEEKKKEIVSINNKIYSKDSEIMEIWEKGRKWSLDYFEELYKKLGVSYEKYYFESEIAEVGKKTVLDHPEVFPKDNGAYVFHGEEHGLHTRVFVNSQENPTYEAKDLGLAFAKNEDYPQIDKSIIMTANEQIEYFKVLLKALEKVDAKIANKTSHMSFGFVNLKEGKMSSRSGNVVGANWLLDETKNKLKEGFKEVESSVAQDLAIGAVKWSMLKFSRESNISFSIEESIDLAGNSGPYMQYVYARICSILTKSEKNDSEAISVKNLDPLLVALVRYVCQFESVIKSATDHLSPNYLSDYLFVLAQKYNAYYEKEKIIGGEFETEKLAVSIAVKNVIGQGMKLLGISTPEKI